MIEFKFKIVYKEGSAIPAEFLSIIAWKGLELGQEQDNDSFIKALTAVIVWNCPMFIIFSQVKIQGVFSTVYFTLDHFHMCLEAFIGSPNHQD